MPIRTVYFSIVTLVILPVFLLFSPGLKAQTDCDNPIVISSILISNATCGNSTGNIILNLSPGLYQYNWTPAVSILNVASNLQAGSYHVEVVRLLDPACTLDTTILVNNSNGPSVNVSGVEPANCQASNGRIALSPTTLNYSWSNGTTGPVNDNLAAGCYYVTATGTGGCYSVHKICVPNVNPLQTQSVVLQNAKCSMANGAANIVVTGGSGLYDYTLNPGPPFNGLAAGPYTVGITDIVTGCQEEASFVIENIPVSAEVTIEPRHVRCPGESNGSVDITVDPDMQFTLPYTVAVTDVNGTTYSPGNLLPGNYFVQVSDADGCKLPLQQFEIETPPQFVSQAMVVPGDCETGGQIQLTISGGTGPKRVDWHDLPGINNPEDRQNLEPGIYTATVRDSLDCFFMTNPLLVTVPCARTDTFLFDVPLNSMDTFCMSLPTGVLPNAATFSLPGNGGALAGNSAFGSWVLQPDGCLIYSAGNMTGLRVDTICIASMINQPGLSDTICVLVNIVEQPCLPVHNYVTNGNGTIVWTLAECDADSIFCINIPTGQLTNWEITDNQIPVNEITTCGANAAIRLDTGVHVLHIRNLHTTCSYNVRVEIACDEVVIPADTTYAVPDAAYTSRGEPVDISILQNDVMLGVVGNTGALTAVEILDAPVTGNYTYHPATGVLTYTPDDLHCGPAVFVYQITDTNGKQSETTATITVICDKILVFNGISPNGDGRNDVWHMPGIEQYPLNEVRVFNRWGQQVFEKTGYSNTEGWDGRWNGRDLPDGTYFYTIDLRDGSAVLNGFLQIQR